VAINDRLFSKVSCQLKISQKNNKAAQTTKKIIAILLQVLIAIVILWSKNKNLVTDKSAKNTAKIPKIIMARFMINSLSNRFLKNIQLIQTP